MVKKNARWEDVVKRLPERLEAIVNYYGFPTFHKKIIIRSGRNARIIMIDRKGGGFFLLSKFAELIGKWKKDAFPILERMRKQKWIKRFKSKKDRRRNFYCLSYQAQKYYLEYGSFTNPDAPLMRRFFHEVAETEDLGE